MHTDMTSKQTLFPIVRTIKYLIFFLNCKKACAGFFYKQTKFVSREMASDQKEVALR